MIYDLKAFFITTGRPFKEGTVELFEQSVEVNTVVRAKLTITALGVYEAELNGQKAGDYFLAPGFTYYPKNLHVQEYDVTTLLQNGTNVLRVFLGQGWYCGRFTCDNKVQIYGEYPAVAWLLEVEDGGGIHQYSSRDKSVCAVRSPYAKASLYDGEEYYADGGPDEPLQPYVFDGRFPDVLEPCDSVVKLQEEMSVKAVTQCGDAVILDFGQNFAGVITIDPKYLNGKCITVRHGEILQADGSLYTANLRQAKATIVYHKGESRAPYTPRFTYMGFRYVEITGAPYVEGLITAHAVYNEMERTGEFHCENPMVDKLFQNQIWGQKSNYVEVPTDCPQRDERMGYTGDGQVFAMTGAYNYDTERFWAKFLKDIRYSQIDNSEGYVAPTIPACGPEGIGMLSMLGWGNCVTIVPELLYEQYGTDRYLCEQYESMKQFVECEIKHMNGTDLWMAPNLGDWLMPGNDLGYMFLHSGPVSNSFVVNDLRIMCDTATALGKTEDVRRYAKQLNRTREAYLKEYVQSDGTMRDDYQGAYIMALRYVIQDEELRRKVFAKLVERLKQEGMQTGFFATQQLLPLLSDEGETKLAYDLLLHEECPGWMYQVKCGATTTWERWDALQPDGTVNESKMGEDNMVSFNHYAFGSVGEFYYRYILGIVPLQPGFKKIRIYPRVDARLGKVSGYYKARTGMIKVCWEVKEETITLDIVTPVSTEVVLPDKTVQQVTAGRYSFVVEQKGRM